MTPIFMFRLGFQDIISNIYILVFNWNHFEMRLLNLRINFYLLRTFFLILVVFVLFLLWLSFGQISPLAFFRWFTTTSDKNAESCNRIPSNYCLPYLLSIAPRFWPNKPLAGLGRIWNRYLLTMLTWNRRDSTPLSAAPRCGKSPEEGQRWNLAKT